MKPFHVTRLAGRRPAQVLVLFGLMLPALVGAAGLFVDVAILARDSAQLRGAAAAAARAGASEISANVVNLTDVVTVDPMDPSRVQDAVEQVCRAYAQHLSQLECTASIGEPAPTGAAAGAWYAFSFEELRRGHVAPLAVRVTARHPVPIYFMSIFTHQRTVELSQTQWATPVTGP